MDKSGRAATLPKAEQAAMKLETGTFHGLSKWKACAWQLLEAVCPALRTLREASDLEKYTEPLVKAWEGQNKHAMMHMKKCNKVPKHLLRRSSRSSPTGACEIPRPQHNIS